MPTRRVPKSLTHATTHRTPGAHKTLAPPTPTPHNTPASPPHHHPAPPMRLTFRYRQPHCGTHHQFGFHSRYQAGHPCTPAEAAALDRLRVEHVRHNLRQLFARECATLLPGEVLGEAALARLQQQVEQYAERYEFPLVHPDGASAAAPRQSTLVRELHEVATEVVEAQARQQGLELGPDELERGVAAAMELPAVQREARKRLEVRAAVAAEALEDLL